jgi:mRNA-degrading endonuclease RelE of RelBE toxin-antitoxin system
VKYRFRAAKSFRRSLAKLSPEQRRAATVAFGIFKQNPFDPRLRPHKIHKLSAIYGVTIYAVEIASDLRAAFYVEDQTVWSVDIGNHGIYRGQ